MSDNAIFKRYRVFVEKYTEQNRNHAEVDVLYVGDDEAEARIAYEKSKLLDYRGYAINANNRVTRIQSKPIK